MSIMKNEEGTALFIALLASVVLLAVSMAAVNTINIGMSNTGRYKSEQARLHLADGGADYGYAIIERVVGNGMAIDATDSANVVSAADLEAEIDAGEDSGDSAQSSRDAFILIAGQTVNLDIDYIKSKRPLGESAEFAARYEGIGSGGAGGLELIYLVDAYYASTSGESSTVRITYRCLEGVGRCM